MRTLLFVTLGLTLLFAIGCQEETPTTMKIPPQSAQNGHGTAQAVVSALEQIEATIAETEQTPPAAAQEDQTAQSEQAAQPAPVPPGLPVFEDFQGTPQLSLFPRAGDFRPADDSDRLPYWNTFIEHLVKVTGVAEEQTTGNRSWVFRGINSIDSVGFFSPLSVEPETEYQVSFTLAAELADGATAGIGILEFDEFLWIPGQYTEETFRAHFLGAQEGKRLSGAIKAEPSFNFTTGKDTQMIHLVLFLEGSHDRNNVMFDDIKVEKAK